MRRLSKGELLALKALLEMEKDGLVVQKAIKELISKKEPEICFSIEAAL